jgi:hypothetical protein
MRAFCCFGPCRERGRLRRAGALAALAAAALLVPAARAPAFDGATVRGGSFMVSFGTRDLLPRIACPGLTTSTGRPGDFSFCRGTISFYNGGTVIARGPFSVRTFDSHVERIPLAGGVGRSLIRPRSTTTLSYVIVSHDGQGAVRENRGSARFTYPHGR